MLWIYSLSTLETLMRTEYFLFVYHTTSSLAKLSTWCFEHSGDISCSLIVNPSHIDWVLGRTKHVFVDIYALNLFIELSVEHWWEQNIFCSFKRIKAFCKAQHLMLRALWWHQLFSNRWPKPHWWILGRMKHVSVDIYIYIYIHVDFTLKQLFPSGDQVFFECNFSFLHQSPTEWLISWSENMFVTVLWCSDFYSNILLLLEGSNHK